MHAWIRHSPWRPADFRWQRGNELVHTGYRITREDDGLTREIVVYVKALNRARTPQRKAILKKRWPVLSAAHEFQKTGAMKKHLVEALLLAGVRPCVIAKRMGMAEAVVFTYTKVFYDVANSLKARDWLLFTVLRVDDWKGKRLTEANMWKYLALAGGVHVLDVLVEDYYMLPERPGEDRHLLAERGRFMVRHYIERFTSPTASKQIQKDAKRLFGHLWAGDTREARLLRTYVQLLWPLAFAKKSKPASPKVPTLEAPVDVSSPAPVSSVIPVSSLPPVSSENPIYEETVV